jgi:ATP-dependent Clp protease ATP-binding subunit ClpC
MTGVVPKEVRRCGASTIMPEHIIAAILQDGEGTAVKVLQCLKVNILDFQCVIEQFTQKNTKRSAAAVFDPVPLSERAMSMLDKAVEVARLMGNDYAGTEHLLLAAVQEYSSLVSDYLKTQAIDSNMVWLVIHTRFNKSQDRMQQVFYPSLTPFLDEYAQDLTNYARTGKLDPVIGRQHEINRVLRILSRRMKNNPILIGEPGVGKTAIVEGVAQFLNSTEAPQSLSGKRIMKLDIASLVAGTKYRGEFEERLKRIIKEITDTSTVILFIDELHTLIGAGNAEGTMDASSILKPALSRGKIRCIGTTTLHEYRKYFEKDPALERRFQAILVEEPSLDETLAMIQGIQHWYEDHHRVRYTKQAVYTSVQLAGRYIRDRFMPDKAIDLLDEAGAMKKLERNSNPQEISGIEGEILNLDREKKNCIMSGNYNYALDIRDKVRTLRQKLEVIRHSWECASDDTWLVVEDSDVRKVVSEITGIPVMRLENYDSKRLLDIETELHRNIVGQDDAVKKLASVIRRSRAGISSPHRPIGSFMFLGPTGIGKTLLAKSLAAYLFGTEESIIRIDMSDYMEKHNAARLVGSPPGYVGYEEGGVLTEQIHHNPYRVVLFDEIEKAHHDVLNLLLQILEEGELKDNLRHTVNFRNTVIIMTSNVGSNEIFTRQIGFDSSAVTNHKDIEAQVLAKMRTTFNPEFLNRIDECLVFHPLEMTHLEAILEIQIKELQKRLAEHGYSMEIEPEVRRFLLEKGWDPQYGARPLRRVLARELEEPLSLAIIKGIEPGAVFWIGLVEGSIVAKPKQALIQL